MNGKRIAVGLVAAALVAGGITWGSDAMAFGRHHRYEGLESAMPVLAMVKKADLTDAQERQVADILKAHKAALEQKSARAEEAQRGLIGQLSADMVDANALASAYDQVATARKDLALEWAQVRTEVQGILTPEQVSELKTMRDKFIKKVDERRAEHHEDRTERMDRWIDRLSR